jgi:hypothetical protein
MGIEQAATEGRETVPLVADPEKRREFFITASRIPSGSPLVLRGLDARLQLGRVLREEITCTIQIT